MDGDRPAEIGTEFSALSGLARFRSARLGGLPKPRKVVSASEPAVRIFRWGTEPAAAGRCLLADGFWNNLWRQHNCCCHRIFHAWQS